MGHSPRGCTQLNMTEHTHMRAHTENQFLFKSLWLINVEGMTELENYHFPSPSGTTDSSRDDQWMLITTSFGDFGVPKGFGNRILIHDAKAPSHGSLTNYK